MSVGYIWSKEIFRRNENQILKARARGSGKLREVEPSFTDFGLILKPKQVYDYNSLIENHKMNYDKI